VVGKPVLRLLPSCQLQPFGAPLRAARARANRSARIGCARQYESIANRGVGGMNGRLSARASTAGGKIAGRALVRRASACLFLASFSSCHLDTPGPHRRGHYVIKPVKHLSRRETCEANSGGLRTPHGRFRCVSIGIGFPGQYRRNTRSSSLWA
jgi:hypothetical protein